MNTPVKDYVPFGDEWKAYVKRMPKDEIIRLFADSCSFKDDRIESLESQVKELREANELNLQNLKNALAVIEVTSDDADTRLVREIKSAISKYEQLLNKQP